MIYLLSEDAQSGSKFWELILSTQGIDYKVVPSEGCNSLLDRLTRLPPEYQAKGSICIIAIDYTNLTIHKILRRKLSLLPQGAPCFTTKYLCIESAILLALNDLAALEQSKIPQECAAAFQRFIQCSNLNRFEEFWNSGINYDSIMQPFYQSVIYFKPAPRESFTASTEASQKYQGYTTLEQAVAGLLSRTTQSTGFKFTKSDIGKCWTKDCCWGVNEVGEQFAKPCTLTELLTQKEKADKIIDSSGFNNCISDISGNHMGLRDVINLAAQLEAEAKDQEESNFGITHEFV